ncbi:MULTISPECIES: RsfA family transcriptional regulator [unclassified Bacillus (in: firmicutes)]|uniref:RsfA family transcriptional regulator n=1 Tax=unclassified Bacillus (in: firmicutes) TaxID=185979 RepID=UPI0008E66D7D|nr:MULTISPECIES: RsfA family transcriptional regulator [unclassified Bacillus (in: firmicutes)]SFA75694.1 transcription factor, RsfA family [Bacillus sp. UNCCL13]SFQ65766.1 transcription factor, RsfA family [Bacillus sp. cl95]
MSSIRQDAWTQDEDLLLAEVVLRYIRDGGTQLQAFEEVGKKLSRTSAACGFRWNSYVRKQYKSGIELAKKHRKEAKKQPVSSGGITIDEQIVASTDVIVDYPEEAISFSKVIDFLNNLYKKAESSDAVQVEREQSIDQIKDLEKKVFYLAAENEKLAKNLKEIEEDYRSLIEVMEKARKIFVLQERQTTEG